VFFFPMERWTFAQTEMGALFSVSNILLSHQPDYFSPAVRTNPFLHTWSLGVEEQFYIVFPSFFCSSRAGLDAICGSSSGP
jgi:peptidoglycan/LPS O-acetylase OafA/YrhL